MSLLCSAEISNVRPASVSIANTGIARTDTWTVFNNPATLVQPTGWQGCLQYENKYLTAELSTAIAQAAYCNQYVNVGIGYSFFGYDVYNEMMASVALARSFGRFSLGVAGDFIAVYAGSEVGYRCTAMPEIGATIDLSQGITLGVHTFNPFCQKIIIDTKSQHLPAIYSIGLDWFVHSDMHLDFEADYDIYSTYRIALGYEWQAVRQFGVKVGLYYQKYLIPCLGVNLQFGSFRIDINSELHPVLGVNLLGRIGFVL